MTRCGAVWLRGVPISFLLAGFLTPLAIAQMRDGGVVASYASGSGEPIEIVADVLEVNDNEKAAIFKGNVSATQGDFNLRAKELQVTYSAQDQGGNKEGAAAAPGGNPDIVRIDAKGKVLATTKDDQTVTSDWAVFDVKKQLVTIGGDVVLSRGSDVIRGSRLVIDLKSGMSRTIKARSVTFYSSE